MTTAQPVKNYAVETSHKSSCTVKKLKRIYFLPIPRSYFKITGWCGHLESVKHANFIIPSYHLKPKSYERKSFGIRPRSLAPFPSQVVIHYSMASRAIKCVYNYNNRKNLANSRIFSLQPYFAAHPVLLLVLFPAHPWLVWPYPRASLPFLLTLRPFPGQPCHSAV